MTSNGGAAGRGFASPPDAGVDAREQPAAMTAITSAQQIRSPNIPNMWGVGREDHVVPGPSTLRHAAEFGYSRRCPSLPTHLLPEDERRVRPNGTQRRRDARGDDGQGEHY